MLLGGLWHGANWTFVFWGFFAWPLFNSPAIYGQAFWEIDGHALYFPKALKVGVNIAIVYFFTCLAWIFFRSPNFGIATDVIANMASFEGFNFVSLMNKFLVIKGVMLIGFLINGGNIGFEI